MLTPDQVLDRYFLDTRCMLVEIGAMLDRYDRAVEGHEADCLANQERLQKIYEGLSLLADQKATPNRSERLLRLFPDPD